MSSVKLNKMMRDEIKERLVTPKFRSRRNKNALEQYRLAHECWKAALGEDLNRVKRAPKYWFEHDTSIRVSFAGMYEVLRFGPRKATEGKLEERPFPAFIRDGASLRVKAGSTLENQYRAWRKEKEDIEEEERKLRREIQAVLDSCTTAKKLCETWPEITETVESVCKAQVKQLPAVNVSHLNQQLELA